VQRIKDRVLALTKDRREADGLPALSPLVASGIPTVDDMPSWVDAGTDAAETRGMPPDPAEERRRLLEGAFFHWKPAQFRDFVTACSEHGRAAVATIAKEVPGMAPDEVRRFHARVLEEREDRLEPSERVRVVRRVEAGERRLREALWLQRAARARVGREVPSSAAVSRAVAEPEALQLGRPAPGASVALLELDERSRSWPDVESKARLRGRRPVDSLPPGEGSEGAVRLTDDEAVLGTDVLSPWRHTTVITPRAKADVTAGREGAISAAGERAATPAAGSLAATAQEDKEAVVKSIREEEARIQEAAAGVATTDPLLSSSSSSTSSWAAGTALTRRRRRRTTTTTMPTVRTGR